MLLLQAGLGEAGGRGLVVVAAAAVTAVVGGGVGVAVVVVVVVVVGVVGLASATGGSGLVLLRGVRGRCDSSSVGRWADTVVIGRSIRLFAAALGLAAAAAAAAGPLCFALKLASCACAFSSLVGVCVGLNEERILPPPRSVSCAAAAAAAVCAFSTVRINDNASAGCRRHRCATLFTLRGKSETEAKVCE